MPSSTLNRVASVITLLSPSTASTGSISPLRKFSDYLRKSSPPASPVPSTPTLGSPSWCLWLVSALQGHEFDSDERQRLVADIEQMTEEEQKNFIEFMEVGAAPSTLENNACKQFVCNTTELPTVLASKEPEELLTLWQQLYHQTLPLLQSILYPIQRNRPDFDVRKTILTIFRDKVLSKVLAEVNVRIPILEPMLFTVLLETENQTKASKDFATLASRVMGVKTEQKSESLVRVRSRTLPNKPAKKVTWGDLRKSATFSL